MTLAILAVLAGMISQMPPEPEVLSRDAPVMAAVTEVLALMCYGFRGRGRIDHVHGAPVTSRTPYI